MNDREDEDENRHGQEIDRDGDEEFDPRVILNHANVIFGDIVELRSRASFHSIEKIHDVLRGDFRENLHSGCSNVNIQDENVFEIIFTEFRSIRHEQGHERNNVAEEEKHPLNADIDHSLFPALSCLRFARDDQVGDVQNDFDRIKDRCGDEKARRVFQQGVIDAEFDRIGADAENETNPTAVHHVFDQVRPGERRDEDEKTKLETLRRVAGNLSENDELFDKIQNIGQNGQNARDRQENRSPSLKIERR